jgi:hypothetical protein
MRAGLIRRGVELISCLWVIFAVKTARAGEDRSRPEGEHALVVGAGAAAEIEESTEGTPSFGTSAFIEWEAIESWLEFELAASVLTANGRVEVPVQVLAKKPFRLGRSAELLVGAGPELVWSSGRDAGPYAGGAVALDFMVWPWGTRLGLWIEPEYDVVLRDGPSSAVGVASGIMAGW